MTFFVYILERFDDRNADLMMDIKLPTSSSWHNVTIEQAREALGGQPTGPDGSSLDTEKARALMLAISPDKQTSAEPSNFQSASGVVHINSSQDWRNFEVAGGDSDSLDKSIEEILDGRTTRKGGRRKTTSTSQGGKSRQKLNGTLSASKWGRR